MSPRILGWFSPCVMLLAGVSTRAAEPPAQLPPPRAMPAPVVVPAPMPVTGYYRQSAYDVWQINAVGQRGQWKARVILGPDGAYYLYNGAPYPWVSNYPNYFQPTVVGQ